ncbi:MAG: DUF5615 family PIN-like protein [Desulfurococcales archaeon]|nr:DUF5615 family PIN-like protein [Desulfurococcales archaeon]
MLKLLADENIPKRLVSLLKKFNVDTVRLQDLGLRGISDKELIDTANRLERTILTRDSDFTTSRLLSQARNGVVYISYQPSRNDIQRLAERIATIAKQIEPKPGLLILIEYEHVEVYL